jgi:UDP-glucose 4-epimerase
MLGFRASVPLDQGLHELVDWWRAERRSLAVESKQEAVAS